VTQEQLDVLLIEDQEDAALLVERMLERAEFPPLRLEWANNLQDGLAWLKEATFDAILLDLNLPDSEGLATLNQVRDHRGPGALIVLTAIDDEGLATSALHGGADEFLVKGEFNEPVLARRVRFAVERARARSRNGGPARSSAKVVGFLGVKGGAGTTTVTLNVAAALARQGRSTIALELKPDLGLFSFQLRHTPAANLSALTALAPNRIDAVEVGKRLCTFPHGLRVLFGPQKPEEFKPVDPLVAGAVIRAASQLADCTLIDLPGGAARVLLRGAGAGARRHERTRRAHVPAGAALARDQRADHRGHRGEPVPELHAAAHRRNRGAVELPHRGRHSAGGGSVRTGQRGRDAGGVPGPGVHIRDEPGGAGRALGRGHREGDGKVDPWTETRSAAAEAAGAARRGCSGTLSAWCETF